MAFNVSATVDDPNVVGDAKFEYKIVDNDNYVIDKEGDVEARPGYTPKIGDKFTFVTNDGDLYEAKLTFVKNINKK